MVKMFWICLTTVWFWTSTYNNTCSTDVSAQARARRSLAVFRNERACGAVTPILHHQKRELLFIADQLLSNPCFSLYQVFFLGPHTVHYGGWITPPVHQQWCCRRCQKGRMEQFDCWANRSILISTQSQNFPQISHCSVSVSKITHKAPNCMF